MKFVNYDDRRKDFKTLYTNNPIIFLFRRYILKFAGERIYD